MAAGMAGSDSSITTAVCRHPLQNDLETTVGCSVAASTVEFVPHARDHRGNIAPDHVIGSAQPMPGRIPVGWMAECPWNTQDMSRLAGNLKTVSARRSSK